MLACYVMAMAKYSQSANLQLVTFDHCVSVIRLYYDRQPEKDWKVASSGM